MLRAVITIAAVLFAGVGVAYVLVQFGCIGTNPPFVAYCGHNVVGAYIVLAIAAWFVLGTLIVGIRSFRSNQ